MLRKKILFLVPALIGMVALYAKCADTASPPSVDSGTVVSGTASATDKMKCWVIRSAADAFAINVQPVPFSTKFKGFIRQYEKSATDPLYVPKSIKLQVDAAPGSPPTTFTDALEVTLEKQQTTSGIEYFELNFLAAGGTTVRVGTLRYADGGSLRSSSDVVVRFSTNLKSIVRDPCGEPPVDDMGEEEEINQDGASLSLTPVATED